MVHAPAQNPITGALRSSLDGGVVLAAVSGGPDSMAMLHALCELARECEGLRVVAAHFDHRLRAGSHADVEIVERVAGAFGVRVVRGEGDVASHARATKQSIETAGRELRYAFLERAADESGADVIATAHTRSDHVETVLMRVLRGAGARGLRGIAPRRGRIVRPLLAVTRAETVAYCVARGLAHLDDPGNADRRFFRNQVRHDVLPALRRVYPGIDAALVRIAASASARFEDAELATRERRASFLRRENDRTWTLSPAAFDGLDEAHRLHLISAVLEQLGARDVTGAHYRALGSGADVDLPGLRVQHEHDGLVFMRRRAVEYVTQDVVVGVPGTTTIGEWTLTTDRVSGTEARETIPLRTAGVAYLATDGPLTVRFPRDGDRMQPFGMNGHKKLSDLFIDGKMPRRERSRTPVVESGGEIVWVVGMATSESARVHPGTGDVIRLTATRDRMAT